MCFLTVDAARDIVKAGLIAGLIWASALSFYVWRIIKNPEEV